MYNVCTVATQDCYYILIERQRVDPGFRRLFLQSASSTIGSSSLFCTSLSRRRVLRLRDPDH